LSVPSPPITATTSKPRPVALSAISLACPGRVVAASWYSSPWRRIARSISGMRRAVLPPPELGLAMTRTFGGASDIRAQPTIRS